MFSEQVSSRAGHDVFRWSDRHFILRVRWAGLLLAAGCRILIGRPHRLPISKSREAGVGLPP